MADPDPIRRSFVAHKLAGIAFPRDQIAQAQRLGLVDLSLLPRTGFKGRNALAWLRAAGLTFESTPHRAYPQGSVLVAVLAPTEALILSGLDGDAAPIERLDRAWSIETADGCYQAPRQDSHYWFALVGTHASAMFAKLCAVDLRPHKFPDHQIAQTSVARSNAIVIRHDLAGTPAFYLLGDSASAEYMWDCLLDAMTEFDGRALGLEALRQIGAEARDP